MPNDSHNGPKTNGSWKLWADEVVGEIGRQDARIHRLEDSCEKVKDQITELRIVQGQLLVKSGVWGAAGAMIPILVAIVIWAMTK